MGRKRCFLGFFVSLVMVMFSVGAFATPSLTCDTKYNSCAAGYYMTYNGSYNGTPTFGNACTSCDSGCTCEGGTANQVCCDTNKACPSTHPYSANNNTYNECQINGINACYKDCSKYCTVDASLCPANTVPGSCTYNTSSHTDGHEYYNTNTCDATAPGACPLTGFTCNANFEEYNGGCKSCSDYYTIITTDIIVSGVKVGTRQDETTYSSSAGGTCQPSTTTTISCENGYTPDYTNLTCVSTQCSYGQYRDNGGCSNCPSPYTDGYDAQDISECYRVCSLNDVPGAANDATLYNYAIVTYPTGYYEDTSLCLVNKCADNYYKTSSANWTKCSSCSTETSGLYPYSVYPDNDSQSFCYRYCDVYDVTGATNVTGAFYRDGSSNCCATSCNSNYCHPTGTCTCVPKPNGGGCDSSGNPECPSGYHLNNAETDCVPNEYTVTYSCGDGTGTAPSQGTATYGQTYTPAAAGGCSKTNFVFLGWTVSNTSPVETKSAGTGFTWQYLENKTFTAKYGIGSCPENQFYNDSTNNCELCSTVGDGSYTKSDAGASSSAECYKDCTGECIDPGKPNNSTNPTGYWTDSEYYFVSGRMYYGNNTCTTTDYCHYIDISCNGGNPGYYLKKDIWTLFENSYLVADASVRTTACQKCPDAFPNSVANSLSLRGGGIEMCNTGDISIPCTTLLPPPTNATSCSYTNYTGTTITTVNGSTYYPDSTLKAYTYASEDSDEYGNPIYKPKGCYVSTCQCQPGYVFVAPTAGDWTDAGSCVPGVYTLTLDNTGGSGTSAVYEKYTVGWYASEANANAETGAISSITIPTRTNYTFGGYYDAPSGGNLVIPATGALPANTTITENKTLYAQWSDAVMTCEPGKTSTGATCPAGSYCPGGTVLISLKDDPYQGCSRTCPTDTAGGSETSATGSESITQCKTVRTNVALSDNTGAGNQTCFYDNTASVNNYSKDCTILITSCVAGRYRETESSITCAEVQRKYWSPAGDIARYGCSTLTNAADNVTTDTTTSSAATDCYNPCSAISINNGSHDPVNEKEFYDGTMVPSCSYTTSCNHGYIASGESCNPRICVVTLDHNMTEPATPSAPQSAPNSPIYLKYNTGWYSSASATESTRITSVNQPIWPGHQFGGYWKGSTQVIAANGQLTTDYNTVCTGSDTTTENWTETITASWEAKPTVTCDPGTYYTGTGTTCTDCPAGSYCGGTTTLQDIGVVFGKEECPNTASTYTAATDANDNALSVQITSALKSKTISECYATNVAYTATQGTGSQTCYYSQSANKYVGPTCNNIHMLKCNTGHWLASETATDCAEVGAGHYSPDIVLTRTECPNRALDSTITTFGTTSGSVQQCYRGNIWYEPANGHSGHRRNCYHKPDESDTNITTGYTYNCDVSEIVTCDAGYYDNGSYVNTNNERDCVPVGYGYYSPDQTACIGQALQPSMGEPGCSTERTPCSPGTGAADVTSTTPTTALTTSSDASACFLNCKPTKDLNGTTVTVVNAQVHFNTDNNSYDTCRYTSNECPSDMWCDENGFYDCPADRDGTPGKATLVPNQQYRDITTCYVTYNPYVPTNGYPGHIWEHGTGWAKCYYNGTSTSGDYSNCMDVDALTCNGGYYYKIAGAFACSGTTSGYYSVADATNQTECPVGWAGSTPFAATYAACYKECSLTTNDIPHSMTVSAAENIVYGASATTYHACSYDVMCNTGYDVQDNNTASPSCTPHEYKITLDKNGGTGSTATQVRCVFDSESCPLPAIVDTRTGYTTANRWCTEPDGSGTCYTAGTTVRTNISADASDITLFAKWSPNIYQVNLNHNGASTDGAPETVYLKYDTGWYANGTGTTPISELTQKPVKGVLTFAGYTKNNIIVIDSDGRFATTQAALRFTTTNNTTVTAQWTDAPITCSAGKYYVGTGENPDTACVSCKPNSYCPGVTVMTNSGEAGINPCFNNGISPSDSSASSACYKELLPTYVAAHGRGTQTCYYSEETHEYTGGCKDFAITTCDGGYWLAHSTDTDCSVVEPGYYSANLELVRYPCPNGGTTNGSTSVMVQQCYKTGLPYTAIDGSGTGTQSCWYSNGTGAAAVYGRECFDKLITACRGGYYRVNDTDIVCSVVDFNYYSIEGDITRTPCPNDGKTSYPDTSTVAECWKNGQPYVAEHGGGERTCKWSTSENAYLAGCGTPTMLYCDGGYWLARGTDTDCSVVDYAYYSPDRDLMRYVCPEGLTTLTQTSSRASDCFSCPEDSVCEPGQNIKTCSELTDGQYPRSDAGTTSVAFCYRDCEMGENANQMGGHDYYMAADTCEITSCEPGYTLSNGQCVICPEGSYCNGDPGGDGDGEQYCSDLGDGSWMYSAQGSTRPEDCYRLCPGFIEANCTMTPVDGTAYWPDNCEYTGKSATGNPAELVDGVCVETSCEYTYEMINGVCEPCERDNAIAYKHEGNCIIDSCEIGYHPNNDVCEPNIVDCTAQSPNATSAEQKWDATRHTFGICIIKTCDDGYHLASNACVADDQICDIANGTGTRTWNAATKSWGECIATSCVPGYTNDPYEKNNASEQCSECRNKFSVLGEPAASSYVSGCEIASCLYQGEKYNLENNECVPICSTTPCPAGNLATATIPTTAYQDETGWMCWDESAKKCRRTCSPGYTSW